MNLMYPSIAAPLTSEEELNSNDDGQMQTVAINNFKVALNVVFKEAVNINWIECIKMLASDYSLQLADQSWKLSDLPHLKNFDTANFIFVISNFNLDLFCANSTGNTIFHDLVLTHNTKLLLEVSRFLKDLHTKSLLESGNTHLSSIIMNKYLINEKDPLSHFVDKNSEGNSPADLALIRKNYDIYNILN